MSTTAQSSDRTRALRRARRLVALASSPNVHEAGSASRRLAELREKYGFVESDLVEPADSGLFEVAVSSARYGGFEAEWKWRLVSDVAVVHDCEAVAVRDERRRRVRLVGDRSDVREAELHFQLLYSLVRAEGEGVVARAFRHRPDLGVSAVGGYARSYLRGLVSAVSERLLEDRLGGDPTAVVGGAVVPVEQSASDQVVVGEAVGDRPVEVDPGAGALVPWSGPRGGRRGTPGRDWRERVDAGAFTLGYQRGQELVLPVVGY